MRRGVRGGGVITPPLVQVTDGPGDEAVRAGIVRRLERFGAGPAASFRDACALMEGDPPVACDAVLVGHLVREVESSVRAALLPPGAPAVPRSSPPQKTSPPAAALPRPPAA